MEAQHFVERWTGASLSVVCRAGLVCKRLNLVLAEKQLMDYQFLLVIKSLRIVAVCAGRSTIGA